MPSSPIRTSRARRSLTSSLYVSRPVSAGRKSVSIRDGSSKECPLVGQSLCERGVYMLSGANGNRVRPYVHPCRTARLRLREIRIPHN